jgi:diacylglycerol kinase
MFRFIQQRFRSFGYAFKGLAILFSTQVHARIHLSAALLVIGMAAYFNLSPGEWSVLILCIIIVLAAEAFNTAIEHLTDLVSPDYHPLAGKVKDLAAAAVLLCALGAAIIGILILSPYLF